VGSLHQGAALATSVLSGNAASYLEELAFSVWDPINYYYFHDPAFHQARDNNTIEHVLLNTQAGINIAYKAAVDAVISGIISAAAPVVPQMCNVPCPGGSAFISDLNSPASLAAEANAFQRRISISTEVPITNVWARWWCPEDCPGIPPTIASIALTLYDYYRESDNWWLSSGAYKWQNLSYEMFTMDGRWLNLIGAVTSQGTVLPTDGMLPVTTQTYTGGTASIHLQGANIAHTEQAANGLVIQTVRDVLRDDFGIPARGLPPLQVTISGPTAPLTGGNLQWTANPSGGTSGYTYQWQYQNAGSSIWNPLGAAQSQSMYVNGAGPDFTLHVAVGSNGQHGSATAFISAPPYIEISGPGYVPTKGTYQFPTTWLHLGGTPTFTWRERFCTTESPSSCASWITVSNVGSTYTRTLSHDCTGGGSKNFQFHVVAVSGSRSAQDYHTTYLCMQ